MKKIVIIGLREGVRNLHIIDRLNEEFNVIALAEDINQIFRHLKNSEVYATDIFDFSSPEFEGQVSKYLEPNIKSFKYSQLDEYLKSCNSVIVVGAPAKAGTLNAFADTTLLNSIYSYKLNGKEVGILGILREIVGFYGKNIILSIGDEAVKKEAEDLEIPSIVNKKAITRNKCDRFAYEEVDRQLSEFFARSINDNQAAQMNQSYRVDIEFIRSDFAYDFKIKHPQFSFVNPRTLSCLYKKINGADDLLLKGEKYE